MTVRPGPVLILSFKGSPDFCGDLCQPGELYPGSWLTWEIVSELERRAPGFLWDFEPSEVCGRIESRLHVLSTFWSA